MSAVLVAFRCLAWAIALVVVAAPATAATAAPAKTTPARATGTSTFKFEEMTIAALQEGMKAGRWTSKELVQAYLARIEALDRKGPALHAVIETNPQTESEMTETGS